jgi:hypothetical protein
MIHHLELGMDQRKEDETKKKRSEENMSSTPQKSIPKTHEMPDESPRTKRK